MPRINLLVLAPPLVFLAMAVAFYVGLQRDDPNAPPTGRLGGQAPDIALTALGAEPLFTHEALKTPGVKLVNFWASWCAPCRVEHPNLTEMAAQGIPIYGINYKDDPAKALDFLSELGNPYIAIGADPAGRTAIDWGVAGVPETFVVDGDGTVVLRFAGPVTKRALADRILPAIEAARQAK